MVAETSIILSCGRIIDRDPHCTIDNRALRSIIYGTIIHCLPSIHAVIDYLCGWSRSSIYDDREICSVCSSVTVRDVTVVSEPDPSHS